MVPARILQQKPGLIHLRFGPLFGQICLGGRRNANELRLEGLVAASGEDLLVAQICLVLRALLQLGDILVQAFLRAHIVPRFGA